MLNDDGPMDSVPARRLAAEPGNVRAACLLTEDPPDQPIPLRGPALHLGFALLRPRECGPLRMPNQTSQLTD
jgi:hypothetical protein